jgi:ribosome-binding ATPase YchF (GTP1/OBG family)
MCGFFSKKAEKKEVEELKWAVQTGFNSAKQDINKLSKWVKHLNNKDSRLKDDVLYLQEELSTVKEELDEMKKMLSMLGDKGVFKHKQTVFSKQTPVQAVLNTVQTGVQTAFLEKLTATERAIIFVMLNSDLKLSYEDLASMLGKSKATIRGQVNSIKQKSEGLIEDRIGEGNKKRLFIPDRIKSVLVKKKRVKIQKNENSESSEED